MDSLFLILQFTLFTFIVFKEKKKQTNNMDATCNIINIAY